MFEVAGGILLAFAALIVLMRFGLAWIGPAAALLFTLAVLVVAALG